MKKIPFLVVGFVVILAEVSSADAVDMNQPPVYDRAAWLADSIRATDLVVLGTPRTGNAKNALIEVDEVLFGTINDKLKVGSGSVKILPNRFTPDRTGVWIMIRTPGGYYSTNPDQGPLTMQEWKWREGELKTNVYVSELPLSDHETATQLYRTANIGGKQGWHGVNTFSCAEVFEELHVRGKKIHTRAWNSDGMIERVIKIPEKGYGFFVQWSKGKLLEFSHYKDGKKSGTAREYHRGSERLRQETHFRAGVRHGWHRTWNQQGKLEYGQRFEDGFIPPVIRYRGKKKGKATLTKGEDRLYYHAPREIMAEFFGNGVGMSTSRVSALLKLDFSEKSGITFWHFRCDTALHVEFSMGKVSKVHTLPNGAHCEYAH